MLLKEQCAGYKISWQLYAAKSDPRFAAQTAFVVLFVGESYTCICIGRHGFWPGVRVGVKGRTLTRGLDQE